MRLINDNTQLERPIFKGGPLVPWHVAPWYQEKVFQHGWTRPLIDAVWLAVEKEAGYAEANRSLLRFNEQIIRKDLWLSMDEEELRKFCDRKARNCHLINNRALSTRVKIARVNDMLSAYGISFPGAIEDWSDQAGPALARCADKRWWRRQVRTMQRREFDEFARAGRIVHKKCQPYCSDIAVRLRQRQKAQNRDLLSELIAENQDGDQYTLQELADLSVSNPAVKRSELMVRIAGFEEYAFRLGFVGEFYTLTCPSRFHAVHISGAPNEKFSGETVRESNDHLNSVWAKIRSKFKRANLKPFGFRIAEPNHDGTCHWHFLLFMAEADANPVRAIFQKYALEEDGDEPGAREHRFKAVSIDKTRGSAAGYVAKYVAKNIDGHGLDEDSFGDDAASSAIRVDAWASAHGIRQFQQVGGPSVTVWRELRRLESEEEGLLERARQAADSANWADFCELMGTGRNQPIQLARWDEFDPLTGEMFDPPMNRYGEKAQGKILGLAHDGRIVVTRIYQWTIKRAEPVAKVLANDVPALPGHMLDWVGSTDATFWEISSGGAQAPPLEYCQ